MKYQAISFMKMAGNRTSESSNEHFTNRNITSHPKNNHANACQRRTSTRPHVMCTCFSRPMCAGYSFYHRAIQITVFIIAFVGLCVRPSQAEDVCALGRASWNPTAVARFGLSVSLRKTDIKRKGGCGAVSQEALQLYVASQWVLERLNRDNSNGSYVPGVTFGFDLLDDCRNPTRAVQYALDFVDINDDCRPGNDTSTVLKLGLVGPTRSSTAEETADSMRSLPFPIISPSATLASLTEGPSAHANFFRTVPSDNLQVQVMVSILKQLRWTYVALVYTNDNYGTMGARTLQQQAAAENICINASLPIIDNNIENVVGPLINMRDRAEGRSLAVVYIGEKDRAENLLFHISSKRYYGFHFIMSDSVSTNMDVFRSGKVTDHNKNIALGALSLVPFSVVLQDFEDYLNQKYRDVRDQKVSDPQIESFLRAGEWSGERVSQSPFVPLTVGAIFALAEATRLAHAQLCQGVPGPCKQLLDGVGNGVILQYVRNVTVDFSKMPDFVAPARFKSLGYVLQFDEKGDVVPNPILPDYSVFAFDDNDAKPFLNVGSSSGGNLTLGMTSVRMFTWDGKLAKELQTSVCEGSCPECADDGKVPLAYLPGDAYIIGVFSIHERNREQPFKCGNFRNVSNDVIVLEAFLHSVRQLNKTTGLNFGAVAFDDCYSPLHVTSILSDFLSGLVSFDKGLFDVCMPQERVVGVVGSLSSDSTLATASFFTPLRTPVISYAASSPDLDDKINYPFFLRTVPSDEDQAIAMAELILAVGWQYVGLLHVFNNYGTKGAMAFERVAQNRKICVADRISITPEPDAYDDAYLAEKFNSLKQQGVKVVVFFGIDTRTADMLRLIESRSLQGQLIFLSSEEWSTKRDVLAAGRKAARGSITFKVDNVKVDTTMQNSLKESLIQKTPSPGDPNPWFTEFWQHTFDCNIPGGFDNIFEEPCKNSYRLRSDQVDTMVNDQRVLHVQNAVQVLGEGLAHARASICEGAFPCRYLHEKYAPEVLRLIKGRTVANGPIQERIFDDTGNGNIGFRIYNIQRKAGTNDYDYFWVGTYDRERGLVLDKDRLEFYTDTGVPVKTLDASCKDDLCSASQCQFLSDVTPAAASSTKDDSFRLADLVILIVVLAVCILLVCGMILGFTYFRRKVRGLSKELQEHKKEPIYHEAQERCVYGNVDSERSLRPPAPWSGPAPIRFVNSLDSRGNSPAGTVDGLTNPAFHSDSAGLHLMNAYSEQSLNNVGQGYPQASQRPHRTPDPPLRQNGPGTSHPSNFYASDPAISGESDTASSQHNYYMAHTLSSVRELPAIPGSAPALSTPHTQRRPESIPLRSLGSGINHMMQQQRQQQQYLNPCEDPLQHQQDQYPQQGDLDQVQYFRMTPSGQLEEEEEDEEGEEEDGEEDMMGVNTYSLSPPTSQPPAGAQDGEDQLEEVADQEQIFSPASYHSGHLPIQITPEVREMLLQQLAESLMQQHHQQHQQQQHQHQQQQQLRLGAGAPLQSASTSSLRSSSRASISSQTRTRQQQVAPQYQQQLSLPASIVYPSSSSMSDSAMGSSNSSQNYVPHCHRQVSMPVGAGYPSQAPGHPSPAAPRHFQPVLAGLSASSPYAQLAQVPQEPAEHGGSDQGGSEQGDSAGSLDQVRPHVSWTLESLQSIEEFNSEAEEGQLQQMLQNQQQQQLQAQQRQQPQQQQQLQQQPQQRQPQQPQQQQPQPQPEQPQLGSLGLQMHISRV